MGELNKAALDRHITGNYGEDQFPDGYSGRPIGCDCGKKLDYFQKLLIIKLADVGYQLAEINKTLKERRR